jgi:hypothetical protein
MHGNTLFISNYFKNAESSPLFFSENGTPWDLLRRNGILGIF